MSACWLLPVSILARGDGVSIVGKVVQKFRLCDMVTSSLFWNCVLRLEVL